MTVSTTAVSVSYAGDGSTTAFPITFQFGESADLSVALVNDSTDAETAQSLTTHYTVSQSAGGTGTLTMLTAPALGYTLRIRRITAKTQPDSLRNRGSYYPETVEDMFDRIVRQVQEVEEAGERSLHVPFGSDVDTELPDPVALKAIGWDSLGTGLRNIDLGTSDATVFNPTDSGRGVERTVEDKLRDYVSIMDHGGSPTPGFDNSPALALAVAEAIATGKGVEYPPGTFEHDTTVTMTTLVPIKGAGVGRTWLKCSDDVFIAYANPVKVTYADLGQGFRFTGPGGTVADSACFHFTSASAGSSFCNWRNIQAGGVESFWLSDAPPADSGSATNKWAGSVNWSTFENISLRSSIKYGARFRKGSGTGNCWIGGKPGIDQAGGAVVECLGAPAADNEMLGIVVGDFFFLGVHALTEQAVSADAVFFRGGPDTLYRSRIGFFGCQFDAKQDIPMDLSTTGAVAWSNIRMGGDNNIGGNVNIYDHIPTLEHSIVDDQGVSCHRSQFGRTVNAGSGLITDTLFLVKIPTGSGCEVKIVVSGNQGIEGPIIKSRRWLMRYDGATTVIADVENYSSGSATPALTITPTGDASGVVTFTLSYTAPATGSTRLDFQLIAIGGALKVQNGRWL